MKNRALFSLLPRRSLGQFFGLGMLATSITGCAVGPSYTRPALPLPQAWVAPLPHQGNVLSLHSWWARWEDPVLLELLDHAERENSTIAISAARISQARAAFTAAQSPLFPSLTGNANASRSRANSGGGFQPGAEPNGQSSSNGGSQGASSYATSINRNRAASVDAAWELDLFGGNRRGREAAAARADASVFNWHDARVSVAAEVATSYANLRACEILVSGYVRDAASRSETARLTDLKTQAGFAAPADAALTRASAAEAAARLTSQRADCDIEIKSLAVLSVMPEPALREKLKATTATLPKVATLNINSVPASALSQRPDVAASERELAAASADIGVAEADRYPRISLSGSIGYSAANFGGGDSKGPTWSYGPQLTLPIFDAGKRAANADSAQARYAEALANYRALTQRAVREVEEALVRINSAIERDADAIAALKGYEAYLAAADARVRAGAGSLVELEDARRLVVASQGVAVGVERERITAWISLYRAIGGGWNESTTARFEKVAGQATQQISK